MALVYILVATSLLSGLPLDTNAFKYVKSAHLPIHLQCSCPFASVIKVGGVSYLSPCGQWTPAENTYPGIETAADQECRQQQENEMRKCDLYLKDLNVHLHSGAKLAISYDCFADNNDFDTAYSEDGDDVTLQCPSIKHSIDIKEIKVENSQVPVNVLKANQECAKQFSFQKMFNLEPLECNVKRDGRTGCILVGYLCEDPDDNGGSAVFPPPGFDI
ncbi:uncharacterized protein LOC110058779 [Orbicella faveolata]|uniref:uncharacterized protein LOC110058779 n=1 Tax=Orbicella faveolata TaxID=48498 RepID=UPI0009E3DA50|nr:uncharacterized protein LOC110058779 [Orbicella faveolata]